MQLSLLPGGQHHSTLRSTTPRRCARSHRRHKFECTLRGLRLMARASRFRIARANACQVQKLATGRARCARSTAACRSSCASTARTLDLYGSARTCCLRDAALSQAQRNGIEPAPAAPPGAHAARGVTTVAPNLSVPCLVTDTSWAWAPRQRIGCTRTRAAHLLRPAHPGPCTWARTKMTMSELQASKGCRSAGCDVRCGNSRRKLLVATFNNARSLSAPASGSA